MVYFHQREIWCTKAFPFLGKEGIKIQGKFPYNEYNRYEMYQKN